MSFLEYLDVTNVIFKERQKAEHKYKSSYKELTVNANQITKPLSKLKVNICTVNLLTISQNVTHL